MLKQNKKNFIQITNLTEDLMSKNSLLLTEVVFKYHPDYVGHKKRQKIALKNPQHYNVEVMIEEALAHIGPYSQTNAALSDFSDNSDSKTSSITTKPYPKTPNIFRGEIRNVSTIYGNDKVGALRCIIYNPHKEKLMYYFLPKSVWTPMISRPKLKTAGVLFTYNIQYDDIVKFVGYECDNFEELALSMDT